VREELHGKGTSDTFIDDNLTTSGDMGYMLITILSVVAQAELDWQAPCADQNDGFVYRRTLRRTWGRVNLRSVADCPIDIDVLRAQSSGD
jgi:hypothetical protein